MTRSCVLCGGPHGYRSCLLPVVRPYRERRHDESMETYHKRLRFVAYVSVWRKSHPLTSGDKLLMNEQAKQRRMSGDNSRSRVNSRRQWDKKREEINSYKTAPCYDCGLTFPPECMQFDHRPGEIKLGNVSSMIRSKNAITIAEEIKKCDLVCANCHAIRTARRARDRLKPR